MSAVESSVSVGVTGHARRAFQRRADNLLLAPRIEDAWKQAHEIPAGPWCSGERARYDPITRCVFVVRDGTIRTALYAPNGKRGTKRAVRSGGWEP